MVIFDLKLFQVPERSLMANQLSMGRGRRNKKKQFSLFVLGYGILDDKPLGCRIIFWEKKEQMCTSTNDASRDLPPQVCQRWIPIFRRRQPSPVIIPIFVFFSFLVMKT